MSTTKWCYSTDEEGFSGSFDTEEEAASEAEQQLECDMLPGDTASYYIGQIAPADTLLDAHILGDWAEEHMDETLADEIGWDDRRNSPRGQRPSGGMMGSATWGRERTRT